MRTKQRIRIKRPDDIFEIAGKWKRRREENFLAITLDGAHAVIKIHHITKGLVNRTIVHPRECFFPAIKDYSAAIVFVHNHPSGVTWPSGEDDRITDQLCMAGQILGIHVLDHIIITPHNGFYSYRESDKLREKFENYELDDFVEELCAGEKKC